MNKAVKTAVVLVAGLFTLMGCKAPEPRSPERPRAAERQEYDCRKQDDKICEVPWKNKIVLYCYKGKIPKVVRYRWEC